MPVNIHGREYLTVAERLKTAHGEGDPPVGIQNILTTVEAVGNLVVVHATVTFQDGRALRRHVPGQHERHRPRGAGRPAGDLRDERRGAGPGHGRVPRL